MSTSLDQPAYNQHTSGTPPPTSGMDMNALWQFMARALGQQGRQDAGTTAIQHERNQIKSGALFGRHLGMGGAEITPENPSGDAGPAANPWDEGGLFNGGFASQLSPEQIRHTQGGTAVNQILDGAPGHRPSPVGNADAAMGAEPPTHANPFYNPPPITGPLGTPGSDAANLRQNQQIYSPLGTKPPGRLGSSFGFGASGSPSPGFSFGS